MNDRFLRACRRQSVDATPVWFMRQAGRALADYRALRERYPILTLAKTPELCAQVTLMPIAAFDSIASSIGSASAKPADRKKVRRFSAGMAASGRGRSAGANIIPDGGGG